VVEMFDALVSERGDSGKIWASLLKDTLKRRRPDFNETYYGFRTFGNLLEEAQNRGLLEFGRDEKSGAYVYRTNAASAAPVAAVQEQAQDHAHEQEPAADAVVAEEAPVRAESSRRRGGRVRNGGNPAPVEAVQVAQEAPQDQDDEHDEDDVNGNLIEVAPPARNDSSRRRGGRGRNNGRYNEPVFEERAAAFVPPPDVEDDAQPEPEEMPLEVAAPEPEPAPVVPSRSRGGRKPAARKNAKAVEEAAVVPEIAPEPEPVVESEPEPEASAAPAKRVRKSPAGARRAAKPKAPAENS
jgi:hypothetical protein